MINNIIGSQRAEKLEEARAPKRIRNKQTVDQARYKYKNMNTNTNTDENTDKNTDTNTQKNR